MVKRIFLLVLLSLTCTGGLKPVSIKTVLAAEAELSPLPEKWAAWKHSRTIVVRNRAGCERVSAPVDVCLGFPYEEIGDPANEIRVVTIDEKNQWKEIPCQVYNVSAFEKKGQTNKSCNISFLADLPAKGKRTYRLLYGNPQASLPQYHTDLEVKGKGMGLKIENSCLVCELHKICGQIVEITAKMGLNEEISHIAPSGEKRVIHWNPDCFVPGRQWSHTFDWDSPPESSVTVGPIFAEMRRSGGLPWIPEASVSVTYRIYSQNPYIEESSIIEIKEDLYALALRNDELVFSAGRFSHVAWSESDGTVHELPLSLPLVGTHGEVLRLSAAEPWISFFNLNSPTGIGTIRLSYGNFLQGGGQATICEEGTYIYNSAPAYIYWVRGVVYPSGFMHRRGAVLLRKGSLYVEKNAYIVYRVGKNDNNRFAEIERYAKELNSPLLVEIINLCNQQP